MTYPSLEKLETQIAGFEKWTSQRLAEMKKMAEELKQNPAPCPIEEGKYVPILDYDIAGEKATTLAGYVQVVEENGQNWLVLKYPFGDRALPLSIARAIAERVD